MDQSRRTDRQAGQDRKGGERKGQQHNLPFFNLFNRRLDQGKQLSLDPLPDRVERVAEFPQRRERLEQHLDVRERVHLGVRSAPPLLLLPRRRGGAVLVLVRATSTSEAVQPVRDVLVLIRTIRRIRATPRNPKHLSCSWFDEQFLQCLIDSRVRRRPGRFQRQVLQEAL